MCCRVELANIALWSSAPNGNIRGTPVSHRWPCASHVQMIVNDSHFENHSVNFPAEVPIPFPPPGGAPRERRFRCKTSCP